MEDDLNLSNFFKMPERERGNGENQDKDESLEAIDSNSHSSLVNSAIHQYHFDQYSYKNFSFSLRLLVKHPLWGNYLWNASRWMADYLIDNPQIVQGMDVLEFGAGSALPSIVAAKLGAKSITITDYPDQELIDNITFNCELNNLINNEKCRKDKDENVNSIPINNNSNEKSDCNFIRIQGLVWGDKSLSTRANVILMCDLIFNHSEHLKLLNSMLLAFGEDENKKPKDNNNFNITKNQKNPIAYCTFTHHRPWLKEKDLKFLDLCRENGLQVDLIKIFQYDQVMFESDRGDPEERKKVYAYKIFKPRPPLSIHYPDMNSI